MLQSSKIQISTPVLVYAASNVQVVQASVSASEEDLFEKIAFPFFLNPSLSLVFISPRRRFFSVSRSYPIRFRRDWR